MRRVVVTGLGAVTPLGVGAHHTWRRLLAGHSGLVRVPESDTDPRWRGITSKVAGMVPRAPSGAGTSRPSTLWDPAHWVPSGADRARMSLFTQYALAASEMAFEDAGWRPNADHELDAAGVCLGSGIGNLEVMYAESLAFEKDGYKKLSPYFVPKILLNMAAGHIAMAHSLRGPNHCATTACTTGAHSVGDASRFIAFGDADVMLAGGAESCVHPLAFAGFARARSLATNSNDDPAASCRPFDAGRDGFVLAEGAAVLLLEEEEHARRRGARIYAEISGYGSSCDAHHATTPRPDGSGARRAMVSALRGARRRPAEVGYVNAHATGTRVGDAAEARAIRSVLVGEEGHAREEDVVVSSTKGAIGHMLGAAGAVEAMFAVLSIAEGIVPPTRNLENPDVDVNFNFVPLEAQERPVEVAMSNSFGFGGTNASLVFSRYRG